MVARFYKVSGLEPDGLPNTDWWGSLSDVLTGYKLKVNLPELPGVKRKSIVINKPIEDLASLRSKLIKQFPQAAEQIDDKTLGFSVNDEMVVGSERAIHLKNGDEVNLVPLLAGG